MNFSTGWLRAAPAAWLVAGVVAASAAHAATAAYDSGGTGTSANLVADSYRASHHGHYSEAIALTTRALSLAPNYGSGYLARADAYTYAGRYVEAAADLDRVAAMHPDDFTIPLSKVKLFLFRGDAAGALALIKILVNMPDRSFWHDPFEASTYENGGGSQFVATGHAPSHILALSSIAEEMLHQDDASIADMTLMVKNERQHPEGIMSYYCWISAVAGQLETAELTCQNAIEANSHDIGQYDSLGYVYLRMKQWDKAIVNYNIAIDKRPDMTTSLYGRGIARRARGDVAGGNADIAAATKGEPDIANIMQRLHAPSP